MRRWQRQLTEQLDAACLESLIPSAFRGTVQSDGYAGYAAFVRAHNARAGCEAITLAGCWAHARRGFIEARESAPRTVGWLLRQIAALYQIEAHLRACHAGPVLREAVRAAHSVPLVSRIGAALRRIRPRYLPQSAMGKAIAYTLDQWPALTRFLADGRIEIDNNLVENAIRPTTIGQNYVQSTVMRRWRARLLWLAGATLLAVDRRDRKVRITTGCRGSAGARRWVSPIVACSLGAGWHRGCDVSFRDPLPHRDGLCWGSRGRATVR